MAATSIPRYTVPMTVKENQERLINDLLLIPDAQERLSIIVARAKSSLLDTDRTDANLVKGCVSRVWLASSIKEDCCHFRYDADSPMVKGLVDLLCEVYEGGSPVEIVTEEPVIWERLGLLKVLSPTRLNGLAAVRQKIKADALAAA